MVEIKISYQGELRCQAVHAPSGSALATDAPTDNMGKGETFSPTDLVATALGTCILTILGILAQRHGLDLTGTTARVTKEMSAAPPRRIARLAVAIDVPTPVSEDNRRRLESAAQACPVAKSLHPDVDVPIVFRWR